MQYLRDRGELDICKEAPAIYKFQSNPVMTHVDDFLDGCQNPLDQADLHSFARTGIPAVI